MKNLLFLLFVSSVFIFASCTKEENELPLTGIEFGEKEITLDYGEELQLSLFPQPATAYLPRCIFFSENDEIVTVSSDGLIKGVGAGTTIVGAKTPDGEYFAECRVTVNSDPDVVLFQEPYLKFGCTVADIKEYETRELLTEDSEKIAFEGENNDVNFVLYLLKNAKMNSVGVSFNKTENIAERIVDFLFEKYEYVEEENEIFYFVSSDWKMCVALMTMEDGSISVFYYANDTQSSSLRSSSIWKEQVKEVFDKLNALKP
jgi:hypothetical protein